MPRTKKKTELDLKKEQYFKLYKSWKKIYCPALQSHVLFTRWGWNHIVNKKYRTVEHRIERMELFPAVSKLIKQATKYIKSRKVQEYDMYELQGIIDEVLISIIIAKKGKRYYFLSVMKA